MDCKYNKFENWLNLFSRSTFIRTSEWILVFGQLIWNFIEKLETKIGLPWRNHHNCSAAFTSLNALNVLVVRNAFTSLQCTRICSTWITFLFTHSLLLDRMHSLIQKDFCIWKFLEFSKFISSRSICVYYFPNTSNFHHHLKTNDANIPASALFGDFDLIAINTDQIPPSKPIQCKVL